MSQSRDNGLWAIFGKFAMIVTVIGGLIGVWTWYQSPGTNLEAEVEFGVYRVDPNISNAVERLQAVSNRVRILQLDDESNADFREIAIEAGDAYRETLMVSHAHNFRGYIRADITNSGDLSVKEVTYRVPDAAVSMVTYDDKSQKVFRGAPTLELGEIKPSQTVSVYSWTHTTPSSFGISDVLSLTHAGGKGLIRVKGERTTLGLMFGSPVVLLLILPLLLLVVHAYEVGKKAGLRR